MIQYMYKWKEKVHCVRYSYSTQHYDGVLCCWWFIEFDNAVTSCKISPQKITDS